ncbi:Eukaryotic/viral aspartic protease [Phytophthora cinnamomi]|uniref:Eukaryotic/viral aspartic protease n=1 Tax=Phytophthora cinnamomi TaxID=4785 RepID=UPI0035597583|nr:Eukaryotic/viral aspartic protease [Phytophthora cinnamomi]
MGGKDAEHQYTPREMEYALSRTELFRLLERDPILRFVKPMLLSNLTDPIQAPAVASLTSVRRDAQTLFEILRELGFVLGAFEMEKVYDWDLASWVSVIQAILGPLATLVGVVERKSALTQARPAPNPTMTPSPRYPSNEDSVSSVESLKRMSMERPPRVLQLPAEPMRVETPAAPEGAFPRALEDAIVRLMQSPLMKLTAAQLSVTSRASARVTAPQHQHHPERPTPAPISQPQPVDDVDMKSVSSQFTTRSKHHRDEEDPNDLFDLEDGTPGTAAAISTATAGTGLARVRLSTSSELKEFQGRDSSDEKARAWLKRLKSAARRDAMAGEEVRALLSDLMNGAARQWYLQLTEKVRKTWPDLMEQFRI